MESKPFLHCRQLSKRYTVEQQTFKAVAQVELQVQAGEFITILGHSGSGKTTLLSLIGGLTSADQGEVVLSGVNPWQGNDREISAIRNRQIGFIFQFASLISTLTALENVLLPLSFACGSSEGLAGNQGLGGGQGRQKAIQLLEQVGLGDKLRCYPGQLSGGQQRRVAIARAFITEPRLILADEPTGDLDEATEAEILAFFRTKNQEGTTFVVVTHNRELYRSQPGARVFQMKNGALAEELEPR
ncbi:ABC transporter ATP-binding protein [Desulfogranum mediterraneum]|uniref:ABC transporter ATP-binding protein n=1 Tax=Desulfogranum mediterraneum TaxID=160661 RepID=UPI000402E728|nr:ABC transporter ATP-binding protein [Desulfogranum mediterraneum]